MSTYSCRFYILQYILYITHYICYCTVLMLSLNCFLAYFICLFYLHYIIKLSTCSYTHCLLITYFTNFLKFISIYIFNFLFTLHYLLHCFYIFFPYLKFLHFCVSKLLYNIFSYIYIVFITTLFKSFYIYIN